MHSANRTANKTLRSRAALSMTSMQVTRRDRKTGQIVTSRLPLRATFRNDGR